MLKIAELSLIASRLYIAYIEYGKAFNDWAVDEQMQTVGTSRRQSFYSARTELAQNGFLRKEHTGPRVVYTPFRLPLGGGEGNAGYDETSLSSYLSSEGLNEPDEQVRVGHTTESVVPIQQKVLYAQGYTTESVATDCVATESVATESVVSLLDRCIQVDAMDASGVLASVNSPAQRRRQAQIPIIQEAYKQFFPQDKYPLTPANVKWFLSKSDDSAVQIYQEFEAIAPRNPRSPVTYLRAVFEGEAQRLATQVKVPVSSPAAPVSSRPTRGAAAYVPGGDLPEPTDEYLAELDEGRAFLEQLKIERGWLE